MTLAFSWATNANYSTGPDTATPTKVDPASAANGFVKGVVAAPQHVNFLFDAIADQLIKAIDGVDGGTYTLGSALRFQGADVEINAGLKILAAGEINVQSGAIINILSGGDIVLLSGGQAVVSAGADINVLNAGEINVASGGEINLASGAQLSVAAGGVAQMADADRLTIDAAAFSFRVAMTPVYVQSGWTVSRDGNWDMIGASGEEVLFALKVHPGDSLSSVSMRLQGDKSGGGGHGGSPPADMPQLSVIRKDADGTMTPVGTAVDASAGAAYDALHTVTLSLGPGHTITSTDTYYVRLVAEGPTGGLSSLARVYGITGTGLARSYRGSNEVYS